MELVYQTGFVDLELEKALDLLQIALLLRRAERKYCFQNPVTKFYRTY